MMTDDFDCFTRNSFLSLIGCDVVAPSDMMDGRIAEIKRKLYESQLEHRVCTRKLSMILKGHEQIPQISCPRSSEILKKISKILSKILEVP